MNDGVSKVASIRADERATFNTIESGGNTNSPASSLEQTNNFQKEPERDDLTITQMERDRVVNNKEILGSHNGRKIYEHLIWQSLKEKQVRKSFREIPFFPLHNPNIFDSNSSLPDGSTTKYGELEDYESEVAPSVIEKVAPIECIDPHILDVKVCKNRKIKS